MNRRSFFGRLAAAAAAAVPAVLGLRRPEPTGFHLRRDANGQWHDVSALDPYVMPPCTFDFEKAGQASPSDDKTLTGCGARGAGEPVHPRRFGGFPGLP